MRLHFCESMKSLSTYFYATSNDLIGLLNAVESERALRYTETGLFDSPDLMQHSSLAALQELGVAQHGDMNHQACFLTSDRNVPIKVREVPQRSGGMKYAVDQLINPSTVALRLGGLFQQHCLISSMVGTAAVDDHLGTEILKLIRTEITKQFDSLNGTYVGTEAHLLFKKGVRLTANANSPVEYDLAPDRARD